MPLNRRGSVRARLSVWFSRRSAARKAARSASSTSRPPRVVRGQPGFAADQVERGALLRPRLGQDQACPLGNRTPPGRSSPGGFGARAASTAGGPRSSGAGPGTAPRPARGRSACPGGAAPGPPFPWPRSAGAPPCAGGTGSPGGSIGVAVRRYSARGIRDRRRHRVVPASSQSTIVPERGPRLRGVGASGESRRLRNQRNRSQEVTN